MSAYRQALIRSFAKEVPSLAGQVLSVGWVQVILPAFRTHRVSLSDLSKFTLEKRAGGLSVTRGDLAEKKIRVETANDGASPPERIERIVDDVKVVVENGTQTTVTVQQPFFEDN